MLIAVDATVLEPTEPTGVERATLEVVRALAARADVRLLLYGEGPAPASLAEPERSSRAASAAWRALGAGRRTAVWRETLLTRALAADAPEVLWSPVAAIPLRTRVPVVATVHEVPWLVQPGLEGRLRGGVHALRLRIAASRAARIVCPSRSTREQIVTCHPAAADRIRVVPHGVGRRFLAAGERGTPAVGAPFWLHVGGDRARKNVPMLLRAFVRYRDSGGDAELRLVGPGTAPSHRPRGVSWLGYVDEEALLQMYTTARGLVVSSRSEGFGMPVLEAMAARCPVVACDVGGLREAGGGAAELVASDDADAFARAMLAIDREPVRRERFVAAGRARAECAGWDSSAAALFEVLAEAAGGAS